jgi:hypothetical protein
LKLPALGDNSSRLQVKISVIMSNDRQLLICADAYQTRIETYLVMRLGVVNSEALRPSLSAAELGLIGEGFSAEFSDSCWS